MHANGYDEKESYGWCDLLDKDEWHAFSRDPLDDNKRAHFLDRMTYRLNKQDLLNITTSPDFESALVNAYPPYAISCKSMSINVGEV
jgi:hypothetical protein